MQQLHGVSQLSIEIEAWGNLATRAPHVRSTRVPSRVPAAQINHVRDAEFNILRISTHHNGFEFSGEASCASMKPLKSVDHRRCVYCSRQSFSARLS